MTPRRAVLLVDHGSRERSANRQLAAVAAALSARLPGRRVATAHLSLARPNVPDALDALVAAGAREIVLMPWFLAPGRHVRHDVPRLAREASRRHPGVRVRVAAPLGVHAGLVGAALARVRAVSSGPRSASRRGSTGSSRGRTRSR